MAAVIKSLETPVRQELAHFGVVYVNATTERFIERFCDIERFESAPVSLRSGSSAALPGSRIWRR